MNVGYDCRYKHLSLPRTHALYSLSNTNTIITATISIISIITMNIIWHSTSYNNNKISSE